MQLSQNCVWDGLVLVLIKSAVMHHLKLLSKNSVTFERRSEFWRSQCPVASYYGGKLSFFLLSGVNRINVTNRSYNSICMLIL